MSQRRRQIIIALGNILLPLMVFGWDVYMAATYQEEMINYYDHPGWYLGFGSFLFALSGALTKSRVKEYFGLTAIFGVVGTAFWVLPAFNIGIHDTFQERLTFIIFFMGPVNIMFILQLLGGIVLLFNLNDKTPELTPPPTPQ